MNMKFYYAPSGRDSKKIGIRHKQKTFINYNNYDDSNYDDSNYGYYRLMEELCVT